MNLHYVAANKTTPFSKRVSLLPKDKTNNNTGKLKDKEAEKQKSKEYEISKDNHREYEDDEMVINQLDEPVMLKLQDDDDEGSLRMGRRANDSSFRDSNSNT